MSEWMKQATANTGALVAHYKARSSGPQNVFDSLAGNMIPGYGNASNAQKTLEQYRTFRDWAFAAIRPIAQTIAGQPIHLARRRKLKTKRPKSATPIPKNFLPDHLKGDVEHLDKVEHHPLLAAIADPNELFVQWTLMFSTVASLLLTGRAYWWVWYDQKEDDWQIWPLPASWLTPLHEGRWNARYELRVPGIVGVKYIDGTEILPFVIPDPGDPLAAVSTLQTQAKAAIADEAIQQSQVSAFQRGIQPGLAIVVGDEDNLAAKMNPGGTTRPLLEREQRQQILNAIKLMHQGVLKAGEPMILDALISSVYPITQKPNEMDWLQSGQQIKSRIFQAFGVNPIIAGEVEGANRASSAAAEDHFCKFTVNPLAALMSEVISAWIGPNFAEKGEELVVWIEPAQPVDPDTKRADLEFLRSVGALSIDQYLAAYGFPPLKDGGDVRPVPFNITFLEPDKTPTVADQQQREDQQRQEQMDMARTHAEDAPGEQANGNVESADSEDRGADMKRAKMRNKLYRQTWLQIHSRQETALAGAVHKFFRDQASAIATRLRDALQKECRGLSAASLGMLKGDGWSVRFTRRYDGTLAARKHSPGIDRVMLEVFDKDAWTTKFKSVVKPFWLKSAAVGASLELTRVKATGNIDVPDDVMKKIREAAEEAFDQDYWEDITENTRTHIAEIIADGIDEGRSQKEIVNDVSDSLGGDEKRAQTIARTEVTGALNAGHQAARERDTGSRIKTKQWVAIMDDVTRDAHAEADGQEVDTDDDFTVGDESAPYPGWYGLSPGNRCNCRCVAVAGSVDDSYDGDDSEDSDEGYSEDDDGVLVGDDEDRAFALHTKSPYVIEAACAELLGIKEPGHDVSDEARADDGKWTAGGSQAHSENSSGSESSEAHEETDEAPKEESESASDIDDKLRPIAQKWSESLADKERDAVKAYTAISADVNSYLRKCPDMSCMSAYYKEHVTALNAAIDKFPKLGEPTTVYRGISLSRKDTATLLTQMHGLKKNGQTFTMAGVISTSASQYTALKFAGEDRAKNDPIFRIKAKSGAYVAPISRYPEEYELIQKSGTQYKVTGVGVHEFLYGGKHPIIDLEEV